MSFIRTLGSLWFAAVLLVLLLVAMACATIFERTHDLDQATLMFYDSWWFGLLLGLLAANVFAAMVVRFPFTKRQIGFVITHVSILVVFAGALITQTYGVDGQMSIIEGQTVRDFALRGEPRLSVRNMPERSEAASALDPSVFAGFDVVDAPGAPLLRLGDLEIEAIRFLPDSNASQRVVNDNPNPRAAVQISLSPSGREDATWLFEGQTTRLGPAAASFRTFRTTQDLARVLDAASQGATDSVGSVVIEYNDKTHELPVETCTDEAAPVGDTGYSVRVLRYLPHATVGSGGTVTNASPNPRNPYIEAELIGPNRTEQRRAFANFPDFDLTHGEPKTKDLKLNFKANAAARPQTPVEVLAGPDGELHVRFTRGAAQPTHTKLQLGTPIDTPWSGLVFAALQRLDHARWTKTIERVEPVRAARVPALLVGLTKGDQTEEMWLQKYQPAGLTIDGVPFELMFDDRTVPLGFDLTLDKFHLGTYPGTSRPRSFESHVTVTDAELGPKAHVIGMNHPLAFGDFTFYQTSYRKDPDVTLSVLSVSRDPGQIVVFAGYIAMMVGMLWVLVQRMREQRGSQTARTAPPAEKHDEQPKAAQASACGATEQVPSLSP